MSRSLLWIAPLLLASFALLVPADALAQSSLVSQDREVSVDIGTSDAYYESCVPIIDPLCMPDSVTSNSYPDSVVASDGGPFVATASRAEFPATFASQDSTITADAIHLSGSHAASATFSNTGGFPITFHSESHAVESRASVTIDVPTSTGYALSGSVTTGSEIFSASTAQIRLTGPAGVIAEVAIDSDPDCSDPSCFTIGPVPIASSGTLAPGTYTLEAIASGTAGGVHSTSGSYGGSIAGSFDATLSLATPVPAVGPVGLALLGLGLLGAPILRRRRFSG